MSRTNSILLQVAFKEAVSATTAQGLFDIPSVEERTQGFYESLLALHSNNGISLEDDKPRRSGGGGSRQPKPLPANATQFADSEGTLWVDYRVLKSEGQISPKHPDFKTRDNKKSVWLFDQEGQPNAEAQTLAEAADQMKNLASPL